MTNVEDLISEMQEVKANHSTLELHEILRIFTIQALRDLAHSVRNSK